jgi:type VI secretion system secreted protein VgrG
VVEVLHAIGVKTELRLSGSYAKRPYCVQFRETDLDYVSRLLEDEGIHYFFLEGDVMVLGDQTGAYEAIPGPTTLPVRQGLGMDQQDDAIVTIGSQATLSVSKVALRDFNPERPSLTMDVQATGPSSAGPEYYDYPGEYLEPGEGLRRAQLMAEAYACAAAGIGGSELSGRLVPGHRFTVVLAPAGVSDGDYLVTRVDHAWHFEQGAFHTRFAAIAAEGVFRPLRSTEVPRILNPITGIVTGPPGEDIHTDEHGRVKVHFHWDRLRPTDDDCSHWVPVLQDNTGHSVGTPRIGWEVLVHFLEGDPDRPVVLGRVYNAEDRFPVPLPHGKTKSSLKSLSSPGRKGTNEIQFEDRAGREHLLVHAERDQNIVVANDKREEVWVQELSSVHRDETIAIGTDHRVHVVDDSTLQVQGNQTHAVSGDRQRDVQSNDNNNVNGNRTLTIGGMHTRRIGTDDAVIANNLSESVGAIDLEASVKTNSNEVGQVGALVVGGALVEIARKDKSEAASQGRIETVGGLVFSKTDGEMKLRSDRTRTVTIGGALQITAVKALTLTGAKQWKGVMATGALEGKSEVLLKVGDTVVLLKDGLLKVVTKTSISMIVDGENNQGAGESFQI